jgi:uncharacterized protein YndB with AHSA1/START domain
MSANRPTTTERISDREMITRRTFDAPARIVFEAFTNPEHVRRWWAPRSRGVSVVECTGEVRVGGRYRYVIARSPEEQYAFSGEYLELDPPSRFVYTQAFEPFPDPAVCTVTLEEKDGMTRFTSREVYPSKEALEMAVASGMEDGLREVFVQLDELAAGMAGR